MLTCKESDIIICLVKGMIRDNTIFSKIKENWSEEELSVCEKVINKDGMNLYHTVDKLLGHVYVQVKGSEQNESFTDDQMKNIFEYKFAKDNIRCGLRKASKYPAKPKYIMKG